jgi:3-hydroxy-D-aspartate aldolase
MDDLAFEGIGGPVAAIDTPALLVDHDALGRNIERMAEFGRTAGVGIRPHAKTHKTSVIAHMQVAAGAVGQCAQKVGEAEILVAGGVKDVLVANEVVGPAKLHRLATLARQSRITVAVDHPDAVSALAEAARHHDVSLGVVVDVDVGLGRCGVLPGDAVELGQHVSQLQGVELRGLQGYHGAIQHVHGYGQRAEAARAASAQLQAAVDAFQQAGLATEVITGAGSGTYEVQGSSGLFTEIQPGSYIFMDRQYCEVGGRTGEVYEDFEPALFVLATVMSTPAADRVVLDAGYKALSNDAGPALLLDKPGWTYTYGGDEHGIIKRAGSAAASMALGEKVRVQPSHCDTTINLYDRYHVYSGDELIAIWPIAARGRSQ